MSAGLDPILDSLLDRLALRLPGSQPLPGEFIGPGVNSQRSVFNGTATTTFTSGPFVNPNSRYAIVTLNITAASGTTPTLVVALQGVNHDGVAYQLGPAAGATFAQQTGVAGPLVLYVGPGLTVTANVSVNVPVPAQYQIVHTIGGTTPSFTYSVDLDLI